MRKVSIVWGNILSCKVNLLWLLGLYMFGCNDIEVRNLSLSEKQSSVQTRAIPTQDFDWEAADWMPTPVGQSRIPVPWIGQGSLVSAYGMDIINDMKASEGWELLYNTFDIDAPGQLVNPYFVLYNKYRGIMRIYLYITTQFVTPSSYIEDGISVISTYQTSILNFLGNEIIDGEVCQKSYSQVQPQPLDGSLPLASNKWYMMQYEMAYDPNISTIPYSDIQLSWKLNYHNIAQMTIDGQLVGSITGVIGASSSDTSASIKNFAKGAGVAVLAGVGKEVILNNTINSNTGENRIGLDPSIFKDVLSGISKAVSSSVGGLPGAAIKMLSGIFGGTGTKAVPVNFRINTEISLKGETITGGAFPSSPTSFWMPGTNIASNANGYIPLYNKVLGVCNIQGQPILNLRVTMRSYEEPDEPFDPDRLLTIREETLHLPQSIDFSDYLIFNPEVLKIATVTVEKQELVVVDSSLSKARQISINPTGPYMAKYGSTFGDYDNISPLQFAVRFMIKVSPLDGTAPSMIVKTYKLRKRIN